MEYVSARLTSNIDGRREEPAASVDDEEGATRGTEDDANVNVDAEDAAAALPLVLVLLTEWLIEEGP